MTSLFGTSPLVAAFAGPLAFARADAPAVVRALERLPDGSVLLNLGQPGLEAFAAAQAVEHGVHVATLASEEMSLANRLALVFGAFRPSVVFAHREGGLETAMAVRMADAVEAHVGLLGAGKGDRRAALERIRAEAAVAGSLSKPPAVLVSGSRNWRDIGQVERDAKRLDSASIVIAGNAPGLDRIFEAVARMLALPVVSVPALWDYFGERGRRGNPAGQIRNEAMALLGPGRLLAYSLGGRGTEGMIERAEERDIPVLRSPAPRPSVSGTAQVVHCRRSDYDVYIGRGRDPKTGQLGAWGNFFTHRASGVPGVRRVATREEAIVLDRQRLWRDLRTGRVSKERLAELHGAVLGCWCDPHWCHGHTRAEAAAWAAGATASR